MKESSKKKEILRDSYWVILLFMIIFVATTETILGKLMMVGIGALVVGFFELALLISDKISKNNS